MTWSEPVKEFVSFIATFLAAGGIGFRFSVLRGSRIESDRPFYDDAIQRAAYLGLLGIVVIAIMVAIGLPAVAARKHLGVGALLSSDAATMLQVGFLALGLIGYVLAVARNKVGWILAVVGLVAGTLNAVFLGQWSRLVNPIHELAAGFWIGTLFVLVIAGLGSLVRHEHGRTRRGAIAADMINGFSPLALTMGGIVVIFGLITAWRHLHVLSNLWSTSYGLTLIVKLVFVAAVFGLGAWNWRRQRPTLGSDEAATSIQRSGTSELFAALLVLITTAILVSLPSPKA